jgi:hypothetical protein
MLTAIVSFAKWFATRVLAVPFIKLRSHVVAGLAPAIRTHGCLEAQAVFRLVGVEVAAPTEVMLALRIT